MLYIDLFKLKYFKKQFLHDFIIVYTGSTCARFDHLRRAYTDPRTKVYILFYQASLQLFVDFNKFLQRDDQLIAVIFLQMLSFVRKLCGKFISVHVIKASPDITTVQYGSENQLPGISITLYIICML